MQINIIKQYKEKFGAPGRGRKRKVQDGDVDESGAGEPAQKQLRNMVCSNYSI